EMSAAARDSEGVRREPERLDRLFLRLQPAPRARLKRAEDDRSEAGRGENRTDDVELGLSRVADRVPDERGHREDAHDDHDLAHEHQTPAQLRRRPASENGADRYP